MGTAWSGGDVSARYERTRKAAEQKLDLTATAPASTTPEFTDDSSSQTGLRGHVSNTQEGQIPHIAGAAELNIPLGKPTEQARDSMSQVLQDGENGGVSVLAQEAMEEKEALISLKRNTRKKAVSSGSQAGSLRSLTDRVPGSLHGRAGAIIGLERSR